MDKSLKLQDSANVQFISVSVNGGSLHFKVDLDQ